MEDPLEGCREKGSQSTPTNIPPNAPIPPRSTLHPNRFFIALLSLALLIGSAGCTWLYSGQGKPGQAHPVLARATPNPSTTRSGVFICHSGTLTVMGLTTMQPFVAEVARDLSERCRDEHFIVGDGGSSPGMAQLEAGTAGIANSDLPALSSEPGLVDHPVAIGYAPLDQISARSKVRIIAIDGNRATAISVKKNLYKFWIIEHMFTKGRPTPLERVLID